MKKVIPVRAYYVRAKVFAWLMMLSVVIYFLLTIFDYLKPNG